MLRTIAISLILVLSMGVMLPLANSAHGVRQSVQAKQRWHHRHRSRAWWRRYRARLRARRAAAEMARRNSLMALPKNITAGDLAMVGGPAVPVLPANAATSNPMSAPPATPVARVARVDLPAPSAASVAAHAAPATPMNFSAPVTNSTAAAPPVMVSAPVENHVSNGQTRPRVVGNLNAAVKTPAAKLPGQMSLSVVALSRPNSAFLTSREQKQMLSGVNVADLRRIVIDKMVAAGGWVTNDFIRDVNGNRVFVVTARTPGDTLTPEKAWTFYFTEVGGRIYGLTTDSPLEFADRMSNEAERYIETLRAKSEPISNK
jgi:hypothetical protein